MKHIAKLTILGGTIFSLTANGQLVVGPVETETVPNFGSSAFHNFMIAMNEDVEALFTPEGMDLSTNSPIYFNYELLAPGFSGEWSSEPNSSYLATIEFRKVDNFASFNFKKGDSVNLGFFGEESRDNNLLGAVANGNFTGLFNWNSGGDAAPMSYELFFNSDTVFSLEHRNLSNSSDPGLQGNPERFRIYEVFYDYGQVGNEWIFALADRNSTGDSDYDDGFFYMTGPIRPATPIPEPSHIAGLALAGLFGFLLARRRLKMRSKE